MASAARAELLDGKFFGLAFLVLGGDIVAPFTAIALQSDNISHFHSPLGQIFRSALLIFRSPRWESDP
jgi:hypothetical protein